MVKKKVLFHPHNAPVHTFVIAMTNINELKVELFPRAPYSLDLTSSDYFLFLNLKKWLGNERFVNNEEMGYVVDGYFKELDGSHHRQDMEIIEHR